MAIIMIASFVVANNTNNTSNTSNTSNTEIDTQAPYEIPRLNNQQPEQVIEHLGYTVSYNPQWLVPNWVAYELTN